VATPPIIVVSSCSFSVCGLQQLQNYEASTVNGLHCLQSSVPKKIKGHALMASAVARAYRGVWGLCPQWGPGAKPLVGASRP
jgi:hypothetical protein